MWRGIIIWPGILSTEGQYPRLLVSWSNELLPQSLLLQDGLPIGKPWISGNFSSAELLLLGCLVTLTEDSMQGAGEMTQKVKTLRTWVHVSQHLFKNWVTVTPAPGRGVRGKIGGSQRHSDKARRNLSSRPSKRSCLTNTRWKAIGGDPWHGHQVLASTCHTHTPRAHVLYTRWTGAYTHFPNN